MASPMLTHNTMVALGSISSPSMSYMLHGSSNYTAGGAATTVTGSPVANNNYFDPTGTIAGNSTGIFYPGSFQAFASGLGSGPAWNFSNNWNMITGVALSNTPP
jgi:hypothetical protein